MKSPVLMWGIIGAIGGYLYAKQNAASIAGGQLASNFLNGIFNSFSGIFGGG